jgi:predicted nucleic acid-binding protein
LIAAGERLVTDAEVVQEILHRYTSINRREFIWPGIDAVQALVDEVLPVELIDILRAAEIMEKPSPFSARDAIHLAIIQRYKIQRILSFDSDFDHWPGLERIHQI